MPFVPVREVDDVPVVPLPKPLTPNAESADICEELKDDTPAADKPLNPAPERPLEPEPESPLPLKPLFPPPLPPDWAIAVFSPKQPRKTTRAEIETRLIGVSRAASDCRELEELHVTQQTSG